MQHYIIRHCETTKDINGTRILDVELSGGCETKMKQIESGLQRRDFQHNECLCSTGDPYALSHLHLDEASQEITTSDTFREVLLQESSIWFMRVPRPLLTGHGPNPSKRAPGRVGIAVDIVILLRLRQVANSLEQFASVTKNREVPNTISIPIEDASF